MRPRICLIGPAANVHLQRWSAALLDQGFGVSLVSTVPLRRPFPARLGDVPVLDLPTSVRGMRRSQRLITLIRGWARLPALLRALGPDIVHVHSLPTPAAVPFVRSAGGLIVSAWGSDVVQRDRRKTLLYPGLLARATEVTATSHYLAGIVAGYLRAARPIRVVPFGVDPERFSPAQQPPEQIRIGTLRHLEPIYGLDVLIEALPKVLSVYPATLVRIAGSGSQSEALLDQAARLGVRPQVELCGSVVHADAPNFLRSLNLFVMPSRAEAFGVAAVEAQACGLPVVASAVGGLPEVVRDGETGLLVPPEDPHALASALIELLGDPPRRAAMGRAARRRMVEHYRWDDNVGQMLQLYEQALCVTF